MTVARPEDELVRLLPPPQGRSLFPRPLIDTTLAVQLPADHRWFVERYGTGKIDDFLVVLVPGSSKPSVDLIQQTRRQGSAITQLRAGEESMYRLPFPAFPAPGGLIPWGISDNGDVCFWRTGNANPDLWPVVVCEGRMWEFVSFAAD